MKTIFEKSGKIICAFLVTLILLVGVDTLFPPDMTRYRDTSTVIYSHDMIPLHVFQSHDEKWRLKTTVEDVDPIYLKTLLEREDRFFRFHPGVNPLSFARAVFQWLRAGHIVSGGSTLTMQTARLLEPGPRNIFSKIRECFRAFQLEIRYSKNEILGIYMTLAPFGGNIEGIRSASHIWFKKEPRFFRPDEVALLIALPQSPTRLRPDIFPEKSEQAQRRILDFMLSKGLIARNHISQKQPIKTNLPITRNPLPREIPHLATRLRLQYPGRKQIITSIDRHIQKRAEHVLHNYARIFPPRANAAILIADNQTHQVIAYLGSRDFFDAPHDGQVDYICAWRSPGSTLKPFIYGLGFDFGIIQPDTLLLDDLQRFGSWMPGNFDRDIHGTVQVRDALSLSLNIPAVHVLNQIGPVRFLGYLKEGGIEPRLGNSFERPGLAIALGGLGLQLEQLVTLYCALANGGSISPLSHLKRTSTIQEKRFFLSPRSAKNLTLILRQDAQDPSGAYDSERLFSVKTGTSYGHRDALAIGYDERFTVGVWTGIPDGSPMGPVSGRTLAVPLLKSVFRTLPPPHPGKSGSSHGGAGIKLKLKNLKNKSICYQSTLRQEKPRLLFPVHGTILEVRNVSTGEFMPIPLNVAGGRKPYIWIINGVPVCRKSWHQKFFWNPPGPGYYRITVIDAGGQTGLAEIELRQPGTIYGKTSTARQIKTGK